MSQNNQVLNNLQKTLDLFNVRYDDDDEKYIASSTSSTVIDPEKIEWIMKMNLFVYSIQKFDDMLTVRFIDKKGAEFI